MSHEIDNLSLLDCWKLWCKHLMSPDSFIEMGFYSLIGAALQRRVWCGPEEPGFALFPNMYYIFLAPPATGKTLVHDQVGGMLRFHKWKEEKAEIDWSTLEPEKRAEILRLEELLEKNKKKNPNKSLDELLLFPCAPDSSSFEELIATHARSSRHLIVDPRPGGFAPKGRYIHCSLTVLLGEIATMFRKNTEDIARYFIRAYDCADYEHRTKTQGNDLIPKSCCNMLAATQPSFIKESYAKGVFSEGLSSRFTFIIEEKPRFEAWEIPAITEEQYLAKARILDQVKKLGGIFGPVNLSDGAREVMDDYFQNIHPKRRESSDPKLLDWLGRMNIHVQKIAMAVHFGNCVVTRDMGRPVTNMEISKEEIQQAFKICDFLLVHMAKAWDFSAVNKDAELAKDILRWIERTGEPRLRKELVVKFFEDSPKGVPGIDEALGHLERSGKIKEVSVTVNNTKLTAYAKT